MMKVDQLNAQKLTHKSGEGAHIAWPYSQKKAAKPENTGSLNRNTSTRLCKVIIDQEKVEYFLYTPAGRPVLHL